MRPNLQHSPCPCLCPRRFRGLVEAEKSEEASAAAAAAAAVALVGGPVEPLQENEGGDHSKVPCWFAGKASEIPGAAGHVQDTEDAPQECPSPQDLVLQCLDDKDESIRLRALDLLYGMVSKKNLMEIVKKLMVHMDRAEGTTYRDELLSKIIDICSQNNYQYITNFEWYVSVLVELTRIEGTKHGLTIASQMLDVAVRVQAVRAFSVSQMAVLLDNTHLLMGSGQRNSICEVLYAAAWICGEYSELLPEPHSTLEALVVHGRASFPAHPEHACCALNLVKQVSKMHARGEQVSDELLALFSGELNPVAPKAQKKVPLPEGLDLDQWINDPPSESSSEEEENTTEIFIKSDK
ncbi:hypothetical protein HPB51_017728 [Rhipicephalus microplus]|uniref:Clathrin/coatomer adaptor adaptin-like N-terminal domain-containing protein n=1 Tax=Rhipicephalus microplus TaxID=6941 RepID=A0A9J6E2Y0_RHIMP|nr:hypothetical protein HPB51_017728 [Rhipicephalus microplus]